MKNIKLGDQVYEGVETVRLDTAEGGTVDYAPYEETFAAGRVEGYNAGKEAGLEEGFDNGKAAGIQAEYDRFWDIAQRPYGFPTKCLFAGPLWTPQIFYPKHDIVLLNDSRSVFDYSTGLVDFDLRGRLAELNVRLDTSKATLLTSFFAGSGPATCPEIDTTGCASVANLVYYSNTIRSIDNIILREDGSQTIDGIFSGGTALTDVRFTGTIGTSANFQWNPLSVDSMKSVITHLKNYAGTADAAKYKVTFTDACWAALEADSAAPDGNTWRDYVETTLGWLT